MDSGEKSESNITYIAASETFSLTNLLRNNEYCDITLFGDGATVTCGIKAHKMILASASPYFREALKSEGFADSDVQDYHVKQIDHVTLQGIVDFIYTSTLRFDSGKNIGSSLKLLLAGADYLLMRELVEICVKNIMRPTYLTADSAVNMWLFARKYRCKILEEAAVPLIAQCNLDAVAAQDDFLDMKKADLVVLLQIWAAVTPAVNADRLCNTVIAWIAYIVPERDMYCDELVRFVPLQAMSTRALQLAIEIDFLSPNVLWAFRGAAQIRVQLDQVEAEKVVLAINWKGAFDICAEAHSSSMQQRRYGREHE